MHDDAAIVGQTFTKSPTTISPLFPLLYQVSCISPTRDTLKGTRKSLWGFVNVCPTRSRFKVPAPLARPWSVAGVEAWGKLSALQRAALVESRQDAVVFAGEAASSGRVAAASRGLRRVFRQGRAGLPRARLRRQQAHRLAIHQRPDRRPRR